MKKSYKSNEFKISSWTWRGKFELPDGSYYLSDIREKNRITLRIKEKYLKLLMPETMKLLGNIKCKIKKYGENIPHLEIIEVVLVYCNAVKSPVYICSK